MSGDYDSDNFYNASLNYNGIVVVLTGYDADISYNIIINYNGGAEPTPTPVLWSSAIISNLRRRGAPPMLVKLRKFLPPLGG